MVFPTSFPSKRILNGLSAAEVAKFVDDAREHFAAKETKAKLLAVAAETRDFLIKNRTTVDHFGIEKPGQWWKQSGDWKLKGFASTDPSEATKAFATLELRRLTMRKRALRHGIAYYLGRLNNEAGAIPSMNRDYNYVDLASDLAWVNIHEGLVQFWLESGDHPYPTQDRLKKALLQRTAAKPQTIYRWYVTMALLACGQ
jgi:hypothetical protein